MKASITLTAVICVAINSLTISAEDVAAQPNPVCNCSCKIHTTHEAPFHHWHDFCHCKICTSTCHCRPCGRGNLLRRRRRSITEVAAPNLTSTTTTAKATPAIVAENPIIPERHICHCPMCKEPAKPTIPIWRRYLPFGLRNKCLCYCPLVRCMCPMCM